MSDFAGYERQSIAITRTFEISVCFINEFSYKRPFHVRVYTSIFDVFVFKGLTDDEYQCLAVMPDDVQYFCKACNDEEVPEWLNSVRQEIQAGFIYVIMPTLIQF